MFLRRGKKISKKHTPHVFDFPKSNKKKRIVRSLQILYASVETSSVVMMGHWGRLRKQDAPQQHAPDDDHEREKERLVGQNSACSHVPAER